MRVLSAATIVMGVYCALVIALADRSLQFFRIYGPSVE
jgi:hypothetical protein